MAERGRPDLPRIVGWELLEEPEALPAGSRGAPHARAPALRSSRSPMRAALDRTARGQSPPRARSTQRAAGRLAEAQEAQVRL
jgi:hypothetical protein